MIKFSNGHSFEYMSASGALGFDGKGWWWERLLLRAGLFEPALFTSVTKTLTLRPIKGASSLRGVRFIRGGAVNAIGLKNPGIDWWCKKIGPSVDSKKIHLVVSIFGEPEELAKMAKMLDSFDLVGLEINASCPNIDKADFFNNSVAVIASCRAVKENSRLPLILKLSVAHSGIKQIVGGVEMVEALSVNSVPWDIFSLNRRSPSPLAKLGGGGVSGKAAQRFTWTLVKKLSQLTPIPIIGPSVWDFCDLDNVRRLGAKAIGFGSIFLRYPWRPTLFVRREQTLPEFDWTIDRVQ